ncbi:SWIM zinc finger family protein [Brevibacillus sp. 179-C9.3 HS]|uniref:SWIM zinc finger family protein n=1 Tax=unclassified Brevibacillus TaxID=2684853 RepID=UPI0039A1D058
MLQRELTRDQAIQVGEQILVAVEGHIIERGYTYFSDGVVFNTRVEQGTYLTSDVQGSEVYHVRLDMETVQNSTCTCPYSRICKHIAATFFQMYSVFENPRTFLTRSQQPRRATFSPHMLIPAYKYSHTAPTQHDSAPVSSPLTANSSVSEWWTFFESWTRNLFAAMESYRASSELLSSYQNVLGVAASWPKDRAQLFVIHANLFHLMKLEQYVKTYRQSYWFLDLVQTAERLLDQLEGTLYFADIPALLADHHDAIVDTLQLTKQLKENEATSLYWIFAYQMLWWMLLNNPEWMHAEINELDQLIADENSSAADKEKGLLLRAHFHVMEKKDEAALAIWKKMSRLNLSFYLSYMKSFARNGEWQRFLDWTASLTSLIGQADTQQYRLIIAIWQEAMEQLGRSSECGAKLKQFLPSSYHEYAAYLYEARQFKQWIDLQMSFQVPLVEISIVQLKEIEDTEPTLLFPFYLREVNRLIAERNRTAYKEAIKLMKKVRMIYNRARQDACWERYVDQLSAKHNRLRAFQEELRRGNFNL